MIFRSHEWKQRHCTTKARFAESNSTVTKSRESSRSFWVTHISVYETQYRWQTTPHFQHWWDRVFLLILFLRKLSSRKELKMWSSPTSEVVRMWLLLQAAVQVVHLFPLCYCQRVWNVQTEFTRRNWNLTDHIFLNLFNTFRNTGLKVVLDEPSSRASLKCTNYCKESDIKILYPPPHTIYVLRPLHRTVSKPFKRNCHQETIKFIHNSANDAITKFSFEQHFSEHLWTLSKVLSAQKYPFITSAIPRDKFLPSTFYSTDLTSPDTRHEIASESKVPSRPPVL